jgi:hypothetical protein
MGWNCLRAAALIPIALAIGAMSASASSILVDFETDPVGFVPGNDFTSNDSSQIHFSDTVTQSPGQGEMFIINEPYTNDSNALAVFSDSDDSALQIVFDLPAISISMDFFVGNYSPQAGDTAVLTASSGGVPFAPVSVNLTDPDISFDCVLFDCGTFDSFNSVEFEFVVPGGLTEIVDEVSVTLIPEPHAAVVFGAGALLVGVACGRRSRAEVDLRASRR